MPHFHTVTLLNRDNSLTIGIHLCVLSKTLIINIRTIINMNVKLLFTTTENMFAPTSQRKLVNSICC